MATIVGYSHISGTTFAGIDDITVSNIGGSGAPAVDVTQEGFVLNADFIAANFHVQLDGRLRYSDVDTSGYAEYVNWRTGGSGYDDIYEISTNGGSSFVPLDSDMWIIQNSYGGEGASVVIREIATPSNSDAFTISVEAA